MNHEFVDTSDIGATATQIERAAVINRDGDEKRIAGESGRMAVVYDFETKVGDETVTETVMIFYENEDQVADLTRPSRLLGEQNPRIPINYAVNEDLSRQAGRGQQGIGEQIAFYNFTSGFRERLDALDLRLAPSGFRVFNSDGEAANYAWKQNVKGDELRREGGKGPVAIVVHLYENGASRNAVLTFSDFETANQFKEGIQVSGPAGVSLNPGLALKGGRNLKLLPELAGRERFEAILEELGFIEFIASYDPYLNNSEFQKQLDVYNNGTENGPRVVVKITNGQTVEYGTALSEKLNMRDHSGMTIEQRIRNEGGDIEVIVPGGSEELPEVPHSNP